MLKEKIVYSDNWIGDFLNAFSILRSSSTPEVQATEEIQPPTEVPPTQPPPTEPPPPTEEPTPEPVKITWWSHWSARDKQKSSDQSSNCRL